MRFLFLDLARPSRGPRAGGSSSKFQSVDGRLALREFRIFFCLLREKFGGLPADGRAAAGEKAVSGRPRGHTPRCRFGENVKEMPKIIGFSANLVYYENERGAVGPAQAYQEQAASIIP